MKFVFHFRRTPLRSLWFVLGRFGFHCHSANSGSAPRGVNGRSMTRPGIGNSVLLCFIPATDWRRSGVFSSFGLSVVRSLVPAGRSRRLVPGGLPVFWPLLQSERRKRDLVRHQSNLV